MCRKLSGSERIALVQFIPYEFVCRSDSPYLAIKIKLSEFKWQALVLHTGFCFARGNKTTVALLSKCTAGRLSRPLSQTVKDVPGQGTSNHSNCDAGYLHARCTSATGDGHCTYAGFCKLAAAPKSGWRDNLRDMGVALQGTTSMVSKFLGDGLSDRGGSMPVLLITGSSCASYWRCQLASWAPSLHVTYLCGNTSGHGLPEPCQNREQDGSSAQIFLLCEDKLNEVRSLRLLGACLDSVWWKPGL